MSDVIIDPPGPGITTSDGRALRVLTLPATPRGEAHVEQVTVLSGTAWTIRLDYVQRLGRWTMSLLRPDGSAAMRGQAVVVGADITRHVRDVPGALLCVDTAGDADPWFPDLGPEGTHAIVYLEPQA